MASNRSDTDGPHQVADLLAGVLGKEWKRLFRSGGSLALTVPASIRRFLRVDAGDGVSLVCTPRGTVELVPDARFAHGVGSLFDYSARVLALQRENRRLRRQLRARPLRIYNEAFGQGFLRGLAVSFSDLHHDLAPHLRVPPPNPPPSLPRSREELWRRRVTPSRPPQDRTQPQA